MGRSFDTISLLTDLGHVDESVGVLHAVARDLSPHTTIVDLCHDAPLSGVGPASLMLARSVSYLPEGVVVASVGIDLGDDRRHVAVEVAGGAGVIIGPDNGLLAPAVAMAGGAERVVIIDNEELWFASHGAPWILRDRLMPAAAHLCEGGELTDLGTELDPYLVQPGVVALSRPEDDTLVGTVLRIDRRGNCQTNFDPADIAEWGPQVMVRIPAADDDVVRVAYRITHRPDEPALDRSRLGPGSIGFISDPFGLVTLVAGQRSASEELHVGEGDEVVLEHVTERVFTGTPIQLLQRPAQR